MAKSGGKTKGYMAPKPSDEIGVIKSKTHYDNRDILRGMPYENWDKEVDPADRFKGLKPKPKGPKGTSLGKPKPDNFDDDLVPNDPDEVRRGVKSESKAAFNKRQKKYGVGPV
jgi:hypothetical protein